MEVVRSQFIYKIYRDIWLNTTANLGFSHTQSDMRMSQWFKAALLEKCANAEFFLVRIFLFPD